MTDTKKWEATDERFNQMFIVGYDKPPFSYSTMVKLRSFLHQELKSLLSQTQQETLEWCKKEVVGGISKYHIDGEHTETANALIEVFQEEQRQAIKDKIKSLEEEK